MNTNLVGTSAKKAARAAKPVNADDFNNMIEQQHQWLPPDNLQFPFGRRFEPSSSEPPSFGHPMPTPDGFGGGAPFEEGMGKRMTTVEVTGMQSVPLRSGKVIIAKPQDLEAEGSAILKASHERQAGTHNDDALMHTTVSGKLVDAATRALVLEVYPFVVRTPLTATQTDMSDWVGAVRDSLAAGVHPAPCALYARHGSKGVDDALPLLSGADVLSAAKVILEDHTTHTNSTATAIMALRWSLHIL